MSDFHVVVVDAFGTAYGYTDAFAAAGGKVIQVRSTPDLPPGVSPVDTARFSHTFTHHGGVLDELVTQLAGLAPRAVLPGRETGVELADALSERLGVASNGTQLSSARRDKYIQMERVKEQGVPGSRQIRTDDEEELRAWHEILDRPAVIKPLRSMNGDGVWFCDSPDESVAALRTLQRDGTQKGMAITHVVAQEYLVGPEYIVNTVSCAGEHHLTDAWATERITANGIRDLVVAQILMRSDEPVLDELTDYGFRVLDALGIRYGAAHLEIKLTPEGPRLIEVGARPSGLPYFVADVLGEGQLEWSVDAYVNPERFRARRSEKYRRRHAFAWAALVSPVSGRLARYRNLEQVRSLESFRDLTTLVEPGGTLVETTYDYSYPATLTLAHPVEAVLHRDLNTLRYLDGLGMYEIDEPAHTRVPLEPAVG
jgi:glutathione synthase/RimK-type ligase-like ATP-grasp enzyme